MATVYTLNASAVPAPVIPSALLNIASGTATVAAELTPLTTALSTKFNQNARRIDALGRAGAGAYAIDWDSNPASAVLPGLNLTVSSGLTLAIAAGQAVIDSVVQKTAATTVTLGDNVARIYLWMDQLGAVTQVNNSPTPTAGAKVFLGSCVTSAGAITQIDGSGVMYFLGGDLARRTADTATPTDTPPAGLSFWNVGPSQTWHWDGIRYTLSSAPTTPITLALGGTAATGQLVLQPAGNVTLTNPAQVDAGTIELRSGGGVAAPFALTWPASAGLSAAYNGRTWVIDNTTGQVCTLVGPDTTQVFVINNARVGVKWDGATFVRTFLSTPTYFAAVVSGGTYTFGGWSEVDADHMLLTPSGGNTTVVFPSGAALHKRGRRIVIQNDQAGTSLLVIKTGGAPTSQQWTLLPNEIRGFVIDGSGGINLDDTKSYSRVTSISYPSNADYTVVQPDYLAEILVVAVGSLSSNKALILPTALDKKYCIVNDTGFTLTVKTTGGTGPTLVTGKSQWFFCNGTDYRAAGGPS